MSLLSAKADVLELRYVRDMLFAITKRKKGLSTNIQIVERKNSPADGLKDKLIKDVYDIYAFSEGSVKSLPKNLLKGHVSHAENTTQTEDSIGNASLATISDVLLLKNTIMAEINDIKSKLEKVQVNKFNKPSSVDVGNVQCGNVDDTTVKTRPTHCVNEASVNVSIEEHEEDPRPVNKIIIAGDSLLDRMQHTRMKVGNLSTVKLTKRGDTLKGTVERVQSFVRKHNSISFTVVLLAGTNDLKRSDVSPSSLIDELSGHIDILKDIGNIDNIFVCKIPPRLDSSKINDKVRLYNNKLCVRFRDFIKIIECIPSEMKLFYKDGLHFSNLGLKRQSGIILSSLYDDLAPELKRKKSSKQFSKE